LKKMRQAALPWGGSASRYWVSCKTEFVQRYAERKKVILRDVGGRRLRLISGIGVLSRPLA